MTISIGTHAMERIRLPHILCFALAVRMVAFLLLPDQNFPDANTYYEGGKSLFEGGYGSSYYMPLYSMISYLMGGDATLRLFDVAVSVATVWLIFRLTEIVWGSAVAPVVAGIVAAAYPHFVFFALSELTETVFMALICGAFVLYYERRWIPGHIVVVLSILTRPSVELLAPLLVMVFAVIVHQMTFRRAVTQVFLLVLVYAILMSPWWHHNYQRYGEFVRLAPSDGYPLYAGNNPLNTTGGGLGMSNGMGDADFTEFRKIEGEIAQNQALREAALAYITDNPVHFVKMAGVKFVRFWRLWPHTPEYKSPLTIVLSLASYGVCLAFSIVALFQHIRTRWRHLSPMLLFAAYLTAVHMVTIGSIRYRIPIEPFILVIASSSIAAFLCRLRVIKGSPSIEPAGFNGNNANTKKFET